MEVVILICLLCICFEASCDGKGEPAAVSSSQEVLNNLVVLHDTKSDDDDDCWLQLRAPQLFNVLHGHDKAYANTRMRVQNFMERHQFDELMLEDMVCSRGTAFREITNGRIDHVEIPAGLNLGGMCMARLPDSVLFFHRMKLRNNTMFRINNLHNDFMNNMVLTMNISLNDLHLKGAYERTMTDRDPSMLIYTPSFGELEILLKDVEYEVEGRYRLTKDRLVIDLITSELRTGAILMTQNGETGSSTRIEKDNLGDFMARLKTDLNQWLLDYLNDYLIYARMNKVTSFKTLHQYDKIKKAQLATFMDNAIIMIRKKIRAIGAASISVPQFMIVASQGLTLKLFDGLLEGLDTMYRRSVVSSVLKTRDLRYVDSIIGFSDLKVVYKYEFSSPLGSPSSPALTGLILLSANDLIAHLGLGLIRDPQVVELNIDFINQLGPNTITVEGAASLLISNFKHLLNLQILTIMSNAVHYGVGMLRSLPRCRPFLPGQLHKRKPRIIKLGRQNTNNMSLPWQSEVTVLENSDNHNKQMRIAKEIKEKNQTSKIKKHLRKYNLKKQSLYAI